MEQKQLTLSALRSLQNTEEYISILHPTTTNGLGSYDPKPTNLHKHYVWGEASYDQELFVAGEGVRSPKIEQNTQSIQIYMGISRGISRQRVAILDTNPTYQATGRCRNRSAQSKTRTATRLCWYTKYRSAASSV